MISINTNCFKHLPLSDALDFICTRLGCTNIEITTDGKGHAYSYLRGVKEDYYDGHLINYVALSGGWADFVRTDLDSISKQVQLCRNILNTNKIRFFLCNPHDEAEETITNICTAVTNLRDVADVNKDIIFMIENHGGITASASTMARLLALVERENVKTVYDPANYIKCQEEPIRALYKVYKYIAHVHVKDIDMRGHFCSVGEGVTPWDEIVKRLFNIGYRGTFSIEYEGDNDPFEGMIKSFYSFLEIYNKFYG